MHGWLCLLIGSWTELEDSRPFCGEEEMIDPRINCMNKSGQEGWHPRSSSLLSQMGQLFPLPWGSEHRTTERGEPISSSLPSQRDQSQPLPWDCETEQRKDGSSLSLDKKKLFLLVLFAIAVYCYGPQWNGKEEENISFCRYSFLSCP